MEHKEVIQLIESSGRTLDPKMKFIEDTSSFMSIESNDVMLLQGVPYLVLRNEKERGFGMDDDPKYWVKRVTDLHSNEKKIIKLVFYEEFEQKLGEFSVRFFRSPLKEAKVLDVVDQNPYFMHGTSVDDTNKNNVRIIDYIYGTPLNGYIRESSVPHKEYFETILPGFLPDLLDCLEALGFLHNKGLVHGDVRWDHIFWDRNTEKFRWIDYDYNYYFPENPYGPDIIDLGKIITSVVGKGVFLYYDLKTNQEFSHLLDNLYAEDFSLLDQNRFVNLKKIYPYIPDSLNNILLNFSGYASNFYLTVEELIGELRTAFKELNGD